MSSFHPKGYSAIFLIFMFERMFFYGIRAVLVLFMIKFLVFDQEKTNNIYGWYLMIGSFFPVLGGLVADVWLGQKRTLISSAMLMILGALLFILTSITGWSILFYLALFFVLTGGFLFKPSIYTTLSNLYDSGRDIRRDGGFTLVFFAINLGAFFAPLICGTMAEDFGWWSGFAVAILFPVLILILIKYGNIKMSAKNESVNFDKRNLKYSILAALVVLLFVYIPYSIASNASESLASPMLMKLQNSFIPVSWTPLLLMLPSLMFYLIFGFSWVVLAKMNKEPSTLFKFIWGLGIMFLALNLINFLITKYQYDNLWLLGATAMLLGLSEVLIGPVASSLITRIAPKKWQATFVGGWFTIISLAAASYFTSNLPLLMMILILFAAVVILLLLRKPFERWTHISKRWS
jgi:proton-dependent oligopeptide transporter, POT family